MLKIEKVKTGFFDVAIRGMRNPKNSWDRSDSYCTYIVDEQTMNEAEFGFFIGDNDLKLMKNLSNAGNDHGKFLRMMVVACDIVAPLYWWKEFDTYKVGTVRDSCSTMHTIHIKEFTIDDFSNDAILEIGGNIEEKFVLDVFNKYIETLEYLRNRFNATKNKKYWRALIQMLPDGFNMRATIMFNYAVLKNMYHARSNHKLDEWHTFCGWVEDLPYSELIIGDKDVRCEKED